MELEEMKNLWKGMSAQVEKQELLTKNLIEKVTEQKYYSKLNKIRYSEIIGTIICYLGAIYLIMNFMKIDPLAEKIFAVIAIGLLLTLPIISLSSLNGMQKVKISSKTYLDTLNDFGRRKIRFQKFQKLNVSLGLFLILVAIPVLSAIKGVDLSETEHFWTLTFPISIIAFLGFAFWVLRSYNKSLEATEKLLSEINN
ncbi:MULTISPECIES: hypothetical protein [Flavobacteriaceae]|uniref:Uncharacterized protein n=2 Tax=Flavobacteriaceae TaxID=49546 RepID=A0A1L7I952_9FLAO|nr:MULTISPECIES: hypothetical protein [Flavobacteriaceae]APU70126.1 hypothetical protein GRFL_3402 [Christiangramia flava JLT2011]MDT0642611.1 hypothetical protein [Zunongwangia sp. F363]OSS39614.1 hypothetical protein C723_1516 [Christiangramia flava JLT2011]